MALSNDGNRKLAGTWLDVPDSAHWDNHVICTYFLCTLLTFMWAFVSLSTSKLALINNQATDSIVLSVTCDSETS